MKRIKLGQVLDVRRGTSLSGEYYSESGEYIRITLGNFNYPNGGFKKNTAKKDIYFVGEVSPEFILKKGDIITPLTEQVRGLLGETATIPEDNRFIQSGDVGLILPNEELLDKRFAYYLINSPIVKKQLDSGAQQTKIRHTSPDTIKDCIVWIPDTIQEQHKISSFLDALDAQISNNRSIVSELESLARLIYDYWFVQFDFPDEHGRPYKSSGGQMVWNDKLKRHIPEGWEVGTLGDVLEKYSDGILPNAIGDLPYTPMDILPMRKMSFSETASQDDANSSLIRYKKYSILFGAMRPYFHRVCIAPFDGITRTTVFTLREKNDGELGYSFETLNQDYSVNYANVHHVGTQQPYAVWDDNLEKCPIPLPPRILRVKYSKLIEKLITVVIDRNLENRTLSSLRDFLLPMLMNGQVTVK